MIGPTPAAEVQLERGWRLSAKATGTDREPQSPVCPEGMHEVVYDHVQSEMWCSGAWTLHFKEKMHLRSVDARFRRILTSESART